MPVKQNVVVSSTSNRYKFDHIRNISLGIQYTGRRLKVSRVSSILCLCPQTISSYTLFIFTILATLRMRCSRQTLLTLSASVVIVSVLIWASLLLKTSTEYMATTTNEIITSFKNLDNPKYSRIIIHIDSSPRNNGFVDKHDGQRARPIPHIIHQMYKTTLIPEQYHRLMQSWIKYNPGYEYYFWTDNDIRNLIKDHFFDYLELYDSYKYNLQRADMGRYFILYHYGGIYADADMECLKSFDEYISSRSCIITQEPTASSLIQWNIDPLYTNAIMICQNQHDLLWQIIKGLPNALKTIPKGKNPDMWTFQTTGPFYMTTVVAKYMKIGDSDIYLAPCTELMPSTDKNAINNYKVRCKKYGKLERFRQACATMKQSQYYINDISQAYSVHHWLHLGYEWNGKHVAKMTKTDVTKVMNNVTVLTYGDQTVTL